VNLVKGEPVKGEPWEPAIQIPKVVKRAFWSRDQEVPEASEREAVETVEVLGRGRVVKVAPEKRL
jgi:hypothetical protein